MEQKTKPSEQSVDEFLHSLGDESVRDDCYALVAMMKKVTKEEPKIWGGSIVGFGTYHYKYDSGHEGYSCLTGFAPRKQNISLYVMPGFTMHADLLEKLGKYKAGKGCLYIKKLEDVNKSILESLIRRSVEYIQEKYPRSSTP